MTGLGYALGNGNNGTGLLVSSLEREQRSLNRGGWHQLATVRGGGASRLYADGALIAESAYFNAADYDLSTEEPLRIACGQVCPFSGSLSDVRLYNRALSESEVAEVFERLRE